MDSEIPLSPKSQRRMTTFVARELLYDYILGQLDAERMKAIEVYIQNSKEIREEIRKMQSALKYVDKLSKTEIGDHFIHEARTPVSYVQGFFKKIRFNEWPTGLKLGIEVLLITSIVMVLSIFVPWHKVSQIQFWNAGDVTLAEVQNDFAKSLNSETEIQEKQVPAAPETVFVDESMPAAASVTATPEPVVTKAAAKTVVAAKPTPAPTVIPSGSGWLYRGTLQVVNLSATTEKVVAKISELGGRKAGEVELGWKKGSGRYFHFTIPESKYEELSRYLLESGSYKISQERHERVMPEGILRVIFTATEAPAQTPKVPKEEHSSKTETPFNSEAPSP